MLGIFKEDMVIETNKKDGIYMLTNEPGINITDNDKPKYVGYDDIGELYSGLDNWDKINEEYILLAKKIKELFGPNKIMLDLGCGDGLISVPFVKEGFSVIAGDISVRMLKLLQKKAELNHVLLDQAFICRMNALDLPLKDETIDLVTAREVLHLISEPNKVMDEIYRILKKDGKYLLLTNSPNYRTKDIVVDNNLADEVCSFFQNEYWTELKKCTDPNEVKYSWRFNQEEAADTYFSHKDSILIKEGGEVQETNLKYFFDRFEGKAFSNLVGIDSTIHQEIYYKSLKKCQEKYGHDFIERIHSKYLTSDFYVTIYSK